MNSSEMDFGGLSIDKLAVIKEHEGLFNGALKDWTPADLIDTPYENMLLDKNSNSGSTSACKKICSIRNAAGGTIHFAWQPSSGSFLACSIEGTHYVFIYSRSGATLHKIPLKGNCTGLAWDEDGDFLSMMTESSSVIILWDSHTQRITEIESNIKDPGTCLAWSKTSKILAYTTGKGNLMIFNHQTLRKIPIIGKHTKRIIAAAWSNDNMLALATIDNQLSINTIDGDAIKTLSLRAKPSDLKFGHIKEDFINSAVDNTVSLIVGEKTLYLLKVEDGVTSPLELGFQPRYGNIVAHHWHGDGYILCAFSGGFVVMISSHHAEIGSELVLTELKGEPLRSASLCERLGHYAVAYGDNLVEIRSASDPNKLVTVVNIFEAEQRIRPPIKCSWSHDGQLLAVVTTGGDLHMFLTAVPLLGASFGPYIVQMSSLHEITLHHFNSRGLNPEKSIRLEVEPTILAISTFSIAAALNNRVYFYTVYDILSNLDQEPSFVREYNSNVQAISMNDELVAVRTTDKLYLQPLDDESDQEPKTFPDSLSKQNRKVVAHCLTEEFLIYALDGMIFKIFSLESYREVRSMRLDMSTSIKHIYHDHTGTYILIVDRNGMCLFCDISCDHVELLGNFPPRHDGLLWDTHKSAAHMFLVYCTDSTDVTLFIVHKETIYGKNVVVRSFGNVELFPSAGGLPLQLRNGKVYYQTPVGDIESTRYIYTSEYPFQDYFCSKILDPKLKAKKKNDINFSDDEDDCEDYGIGSAVSRPKYYRGGWVIMNEMIKFGRWAEAYQECRMINQHRFWERFAISALEAMKINYAIRAYAKMKDFSMVFDLKKIELMRDDFRICCGHVAVILGNFSHAEDTFMASREPYEALHLRMALNQWPEAESLAHQFADEYVCEVSAKYAMQEESLGNHYHALELYQKALEHVQAYVEDVPEDFLDCESGIARTSILCGNPTKGMDIALSLGDPILTKECAVLLENAKLYAEGAYLYEECQNWDKAALLYIRTKNWPKVEALLPHCSSPAVFSQYGKAKEVEGKYLEAAESFEKAEDIEGACRNYTKVHRPDDAIRLVKKFKSIGGALVTARYFENRQDYDTAIRFLILSNCQEDALQMAFRYGKSEMFVSIAQDLVSSYEYTSGHGILPVELKESIKRVGQYFEEQKDNVKAGKYYHIAGQYRKAFIILMKSASSGVAYDEENLLNLLTEATAACRDEHFEKQYVEFCLGEKDGNPKDPSHLLTYYLKVRKYSEATRTAIIMSTDYLQSGNYKGAHKALVQAVKTMRKSKHHVKQDLMDALITVHSFNLTSKQAAAQNTVAAARLTLRVLDNLSKFPKHAVQIMTQAVIFCQKVGLSKTAMKTCFELMKPENRSQIPSQYKAKFETFVRKSAKAKLTDAPDEFSSCPYCTNKVHNYQLLCPHCTAHIPFCIASGRHIIVNDLTACPRCDFPAIRREVISLLSKESNGQTCCPLCEEPVGLSEWVAITDFNPYLQRSVTSE